MAATVACDGMRWHAMACEWKILSGAGALRQVNEAADAMNKEMKESGAGPTRPA